MLKLIWFISVSQATDNTVSNRWSTLDGNPVQLLAHRGYSSRQPEHTLGSYWLASVSNSDYVEPDLVLTKDGILVCHHNLFIKDDTNILDHPEFFYKRRNYTGIVDRVYKTIKDEFFISDFTLQELQTLRVKQKSIGIRSFIYDELFTIPSFKEFLSLINEVSYQLRKPINIAPELKESNYHQQFYPDHYFEDEVLKILNDTGYPLLNNQPPACKYNNELIPCGKVIIQNFNFESLKYLATKVDIGQFELMILNSDTPYYFTYQGLEELSQVIQWYSIAKQYLFQEIPFELQFRDKEWNTTLIHKAGGFIKSKDLVTTAHTLSLKLSIYTVYDTNEPSQIRCCSINNLPDEVNHYFQLGIDGLFIENIHEILELRMKFSSPPTTNHPISTTLLFILLIGGAWFFIN